MPPQLSLYPILMLCVELRGTDVEPIASDKVFTSFLCAGEVEAVKTTVSSGLVSVFRENNPVELQMSWETLQSILSWDLSYQENKCPSPQWNKLNLCLYIRSTETFLSREACYFCQWGFIEHLLARKLCMSLRIKGKKYSIPRGI